MTILLKVALTIFAIISYASANIPVKCTKPNQIYSKNGNHPCQNTCENPDFSAVCKYAAGNYSGCICKTGYLESFRGNCIPAKKCKDCASKPNEIYSECDNHFCQNSCQSPGNIAACSIAANSCYPGCICREGYLRDYEGKCVYKDDCPPRCPLGEKYQTCGTACPITCENKDNPPTTCTENCVEGCFCIEGFVRDTQSGVCVPPEDCPLPVCPDPNEKYYECKPCSYTCENPSFPCTAVCTPGCECKEGYIRQSNREGACIPKKSCPKCPSNEEYTSCGLACPKSCKNQNRDPSTCFQYCADGCFCKKGYIRDEDSGKCVLPKNCPIPTEVCEDPNAEYLTCKRCVPSCDNLYPSCTESCEPAGCYCKEGFVRNSESNNTCVSRAHCYKCGIHEEYEYCGTFCRGTCAGIRLKGLPCSSYCTEGCYCKRGFVRITDDGKCIAIKDCPPECPVNEEYNTCGTACPITCKNKDNPPKCCTKKCVKSCFCKKGYVRDEVSGKCIPPQQCPVEVKCGTNEEWLTNCAKNQNTCQKSYDPALGSKPGCCCKKGFVREFTGGKCIRRFDCYEGSESDEDWD